MLYALQEMEPRPMPPLTNAAPPSDKAGPTGWNGRFSITITLVTAIGLLTLISVGGVLGVGVWLAQKNTFALLSDIAHQEVSGAVERIEQHLRPAEYQAVFLAEQLADGKIDPKDSQRLNDLFTGALAAAPQIDSVLFIDNNLQAIFVANGGRHGKVAKGRLDYSKDPEIERRMAAVVSGPNWDRPIWRDSAKRTYISVAVPVFADGNRLGVVVAAVSVEGLSNFVSSANLSATGSRFILFGRDQVLAHPLIVPNYPGRTNENPLPPLAGFHDIVLAAMWQQEDRYDLHLELPEGTEGHVVHIGPGRFIFFYQMVYGFGEKPLIAGIYFEREEVGQEVRRMVISLIVGIAALILSVLAAIYIGRRIAQPIVRFSSASSKIRDMEISEVGDLPGSIFRELNDQSRSFNAMLRALRWFEFYVPKKIVEQLVKQGDVRGMVSDARNITVLFTDMVGFSTLSQDMTASEVAALVNHHFSLIGACIDAEGGTIDKFMGDSVMAYWGAPEKQKNRAERACRAAKAIETAIRTDNAARQAEGEPPIGIRIGIHSGRVTVGNIGTPDHINYTIIGDDVNVGARLEQLGKELYPPNTDVSILISGDTKRDLNETFDTELAGRFELKGRAGEVEVYRLI